MTDADAPSHCFDHVLPATVPFTFSLSTPIPVSLLQGANDPAHDNPIHT